MGRRISAMQSSRASRRTTLLKAWTALVVTVAVALVGFVVWSKRVEWFVFPGKWRAVMACYDPKAEVQGPKFAEAMNALLLAQGASFSDGSEVRMSPIQGRDGSPLFFVCRKARPGEHPLFDAHGLLVRTDFGGPEDHGDGSKHRVVRRGQHDAVVTWHSRGRLSALGPGSSIPRSDVCSGDARGWISEGVQIDLNDLLIPDPLSYPRPKPLPLEAIDVLLATGDPGNALRAVALLESASPAGVEHLVPLLSHGDADVRARAVAVLGLEKRGIGTMATLLRDPASQVRLAAARAVRGNPGWVKALLPLTEDSDVRVSGFALSLLCEAQSLDTARAAFCDLLKRRSPFALLARESGVTGLLTPEAAEAVVAWLESEPPPVVRWRDSERPVSRMFLEADPLSFQALGSRLSALYRSQSVELGDVFLPRLLCASSDPEAEGVLAELLSDPKTDRIDEHRALLDDLLSYRRRPESVALKKALWLLAQPGAPLDANTPDGLQWPRRESNAERALLLLANARELDADRHLIELAQRASGRFPLADWESWELAPKPVLDAITKISSHHRELIEGRHAVWATRRASSEATNRVSYRRHGED